MTMSSRKEKPIPSVSVANYLSTLKMVRRILIGAYKEYLTLGSKIKQLAYFCTHTYDHVDTNRLMKYLGDKNPSKDVVTGKIYKYMAHMQMCIMTTFALPYAQSFRKRNFLRILRSTSFDWMTKLDFSSSLRSGTRTNDALLEKCGKLVAALMSIQ
jgi:hypothetical protein